ncbi:MAG: phage tail protein [Burkholderiales bacterium]|nr:phage tail protein [Burkholderiales bacterium]
MEPFLGEIKICAFQFAPGGWAFCDGALLQINQNQALYALLGVQYGGDGIKNFGLPDLRGRTPVHRELPSYPMGAKAGAEGVALTASTLPAHSHTVVVSTSRAKFINVGPGADRLLATSYLYNATNPSIEGPGKNLYAAASNLTPLDTTTCSATGAGAAHDNMQASLVVNYIIAVRGIFPPRD